MPFSPFPAPSPAGLLLRGANALLAREPRSRDQLAAHAGKSLRVALGEWWDLRASIGSDGGLLPCDASVVPDVTLSVPADRLRDIPQAWRQQGQAGLTSLMQIQGDAALAGLVAELAGSLRWDVEEDLSHRVGDVLAVRLVAGARGAAHALRQAVQRAQDNMGEYLGDESGIAVRSAEFHGWSERCRLLEQRLNALDLRLQALERAC